MIRLRLLRTLLISLFLSPAAATNDRGIEMPWYRFRLYSTLDAQVKYYASQLRYTEESWNNPRANEIEYYNYNSLLSSTGFNEGADQQQEWRQAMEGLGFTDPAVWNCFINHYADFTWDQLAEQGVVIYAVILGWNEHMWNTVESLPDTEYLMWNELSLGQQAAAEELCFTKELWNAVGLEGWDSLPRQPLVVTNSPTSAPIRSATNPPTQSPQETDDADDADDTDITDDKDDERTITLSIDELRYVPWNQLAERTRRLGGEIGYNEESWNSPGTANIEYYSIQSMYDSDLAEAAEVVSAMGYADDDWDCYVNHYVALSWRQLEAANLDQHLVALGWTKQSWSGDIDQVPESEAKFWNDLTDEERQGALGLCYRYQTWDGYPLDHEEWQKQTGTGTSMTFPPLGSIPTETSSAVAVVNWKVSISWMLGLASAWVLPMLLH